MIIECIKEGFVLTNKNLQVTVIRIVATIICFIALIFSLAIPMMAAVFYLGLDIVSAQDLWPLMMNNPLVFVSRYLGVIMLIGFSLICYVLFISLMFIYYLGGSIGVLRNAAVNLNATFSFSSFFREAGYNFGRLYRMLTLVAVVISLLLIAFLLISAVAAALVSFISGSTTFIGIYFKSFLLLAVILFGAITLFASFVFSTYSVVICVIERASAMDSMKKTFVFLKDKPMAFLYCILLFAGAVVLSVLLFAIRVPIGFVPLLGPLFSSILWIMSFLIQSYISVAVWASLVAYYIKVMNYPVYTAEVDICSEAKCLGS